MMMRMFAGSKAICLAICLAVSLTGAVLAAVGALGQTPAPTQNVIHVEIKGLRNDKGQMLCALYSSAEIESFPKKADKAVARLTAPIGGGKAICEFAGILPWTYAVSVVHDENSNGKLDTNFIGMPREGVGASNDAKGHMGPPKFSAASFRYDGGRFDLTIHIRYL
jgi:uncharacterized protein (DUF2141 family)